ncbi:hypothetical protein T265_10185 [Opisthorchis viverrini]|uniref:Uncharacterized protein n=1 Tax=Opisthorchis viverrini TaxID=6198 RepID=A0A074ZE86_OPIVI|nr:hypothetical protein T265_10185 [Opisthorchis viverrini]KER21520.1 hypothetical protein T265_10185 [Opisthorchis viverrini]
MFNLPPGGGGSDTGGANWTENEERDPEACVDGGGGGGGANENPVMDPSVAGGGGGGGCESRKPPLKLKAAFPSKAAGGKIGGSGNPGTGGRLIESLLSAPETVFAAAKAAGDLPQFTVNRWPPKIRRS